MPTMSGRNRVSERERRGGLAAALSPPASAASPVGPPPRGDAALDPSEYVGTGRWQGVARLAISITRPVVRAARASQAPASPRVHAAPSPLPLGLESRCPLGMAPLCPGPGLACPKGL
eukprot:scaffold2616_cov106-Isochrysis_galbana.AAC.3